MRFPARTAYPARLRLSQMSDMDRDQAVAANREAWNEAAPKHKDRNLETLIGEFRVSGHSCLDDIETRLQRLEGLKEKGLLTDGEYQAKREEIIGEV